MAGGEMRKKTLRMAAFAAPLLAVQLAPLGFASGAEPRVGPAAPGAPAAAQLPAGEATSRFTTLGIGKSIVIDLPADIKDVLVADPKIANAVIRSARRAYLIGVTVGQTNVFFFDSEGRQIAGFDIAVTRDLNGVRG